MARLLSLLVAMAVAIAMGLLVTAAPWKLAANVLLGVIALVLTLINVEWGLALVIFFVPLAVQHKVAGLPTVAPVKLGTDDLLTVCIVLGALLNMARTKRVFWTASPLNLPLISYLAASLVSLAAIVANRGIGPAFLLSFLHLLKWYESVMLYCIVVGSTTTLRQVRRYLTLGLVGCAVVAVIQLVQRQTGASPELTGTLPSGQIIQRTIASFESDAVLGAYYAFFLGLILSLALSAQRRHHRWLMTGFGLMVAVTLFLTYNRASYVAALFMLVVLAWLTRRWRMLGVLAVVVLLFSLLPGVQERLAMTIQSRNPVTGQMTFDESSTARLGMWARAMRYFWTSPIIGIGFWGQRSLRYYGSTAHSQYFTILVETGLVGILTFGWIFWRSFRSANVLRRSTADPLVRTLTTGVMAGLAAVLCHAIFTETFDSFRLTSPLWFYLGLVMAAKQIGSPTTQPAAQPPSPAVTSTRMPLPRQIAPRPVP